MSENGTQMDMFAGAAAATPGAPASTPAGRGKPPNFPVQSSLLNLGPSGNAILALPAKPTCTPAEAAAAIGVSERQIKYWVEDGTLLAINSARDPVRKDKEKKSTYDRWRVVVHRAGHEENKFAAFLTLAELVERASNKHPN